MSRINVILLTPAASRLASRAPAQPPSASATRPAAHRPTPCSTAHTGWSGQAPAPRTSSSRRRCCGRSGYAIGVERPLRCPARVLTLSTWHFCRDEGLAATVTGDLGSESLPNAALRALSAATGGVVLGAEHTAGRRPAHLSLRHSLHRPLCTGDRGRHSHGAGRLAPLARWPSGVEPRVDQVNITIGAVGQGMHRVAGP